MSERKDEQKLATSDSFFGGSGITRRDFFKYAGASAAAVATVGIAGCNDDDNNRTTNETVNLGSGDIGILNFAYALEQLEAAFYIQVVNNPFGFQGKEEQIFNDLMTHERTHRDFLNAVLNSIAQDQIIPDLTPNFDSVDFSDRNSVLATAQALEDTGVGAYNGAGPLIQETDYLIEAGKIVSVEARHASAIRDLINPNSASFAGDDVVDTDTGLGISLSVSEVLNNAGPFIEEDLDASNVGQ